MTTASQLQPVLAREMFGRSTIAAATDPSSMKDGFIGFPGGMNLGADPLALLTTQCQNAVNMTFRGYIPRTRPSFGKMTLATDIPYTTFHGAGVYSLNSGDQVIAVLDGKVWAIHIDSSMVFCLTDIYGLKTLPVPHGRIWTCQAEHFFIIQDGITEPIIIGPDGARHANLEDNEVPVGSIMAYGQGRLFLVPAKVGDEDGRRYFLAGDIMWPTQPDRLLKFTETQYLAGGGAMALPNELGFITGMTFVRNNNSGSGLGGLMVMARGGASLFSVNAPRSTWQDIDISYVLFTTGGSVSPDAIIPVNSDIVFRSLDGVRTMIYSIQNSQSMSSIPISGTFGSRLIRDLEPDLAFAAGVVWDNYLMFTTERDGQFWKALAVFDYAPVSVLGQTTTAITSGFWTFRNLHKPLQARIGGTLGVIMVCRDDGLLCLYRPLPEAPESVRSRLYTGVMSFKAPFELKQLLELSISISDVTMPSSIIAYAKPRGYARWIPLGDLQIEPVEGYARGVMLTIPVPSAVGCDPITGENLLVADDFQFAFEVTGNLKIDKFLARCSFTTHGARLLSEMSTGDHATFPGVELESSDYNSTGEVS